MDVMNMYKPAKLYFEQYEPGSCLNDLAPIIFVHGLCSLHTTWSKVWKRIAEKTQRKVYVIDIRNHGESEWNDCFAMDAHLVDLENFMAQNGFKKCSFVGHSLGGRIAMLLAIRKPELVDKLVIEDVQLKNCDPKLADGVMSAFDTFLKIKHLPKTVTELQIREFIYRLVQVKFPELGNVASTLPLKKTADGSYSFDFNVETIHKSMIDRSAHDIDFQNCQKFLGAALVIFAGSFVEEDDTIAEYFPNSEFQKYENKGHFLHKECSDEYIEKVSTFINN